MSDRLAGGDLFQQFLCDFHRERQSDADLGANECACAEMCDGRHEIQYLTWLKVRRMAPVDEHQRVSPSPEPGLSARPLQQPIGIDAMLVIVVPRADPDVRLVLLIIKFAVAEE